MGFNSYASKPCGEGLAIFLELSVELAGLVEPATGFVVNVLEIDRKVRDTVVPLFSSRIRQDFKAGKHIGFSDLTEVLTIACDSLSGKFGSSKLTRLGLALNPQRRLEIENGECRMTCFSEKFEFAAMHKLWNDGFSSQWNDDVFGKCANPSGHGHNYVLEVTIDVSRNTEKFRIGEFERIVEKEFVRLVDHKNLNVDVAELGQRIPTVENLASLAWEKLAGKFSPDKLHSVTVWETDRTRCTFSGQ
jgi:6-pyruvoyltetrahydropterin/6-carboxytetrahydropterin synthase